MNSQSETVCLIEKPNKRLRKKSRYDLESDLPAPPPPPPLSADKSQSKNKNNEISQNVEDAFLCLSKLYSLVEEIIEIRDKNSKLFKRVRELERIKVSRKSCNELEKNLTSGQDIYLPDEDVGFAESLLGAMLSSSYDDDDRYQPRRNSSLNRVSSSSTTTTTTATTPRKRDNNNSRSLTIDQRRVSCPIVAGQDTQFFNNRRNSMKIMKNSSSIKRPSLVFGQPKVSKWTRVKAAFKWEKTACNNSDIFMNSCNSTIIDSNSLKYLKIPDGNTTGVILSEASAPTTPVGTISSSSSIDDVFHRTHRTQLRRIARRDNDIEEKSDSDPSRRSRSLDGETSTPMTTFIHDQPCSKEVLNSGKIEYRIHKTPWGKMKDIMQLRRDSLGRQINSRNSRHEDNHSTSSLDSTDIHRTDLDGRQPRVRVTSEPSQSSLPVKKCLVKNFEMTDLATRRLTPMLTITVPSSEELRTLSSPESITPPLPPLAQRQLSDSGCKIERINCSPGSPVSGNSGINNRSRSRVSQDDFRRQQSSKGDSLGSSPKTQRRNSKWNKVKRAFLTGPTSVPTSPSRISLYFFDDGDGTACSYSASASAEDLDNDASSTNNPAAQAEIQRNYRLLHDKLGAEFYRKLAEWEKLKAIKDLRSANRDRESRLLCEERLTPEFKKKLEEWKRMSKGSMTNEPRSVNKRRITDWQLWRSSSKTENKIDSTVQNSTGLSDDFIKKMEEWKKIKSASVRRNEDFDVKTLVGDDEREKIKEEEEDEEMEDDNCEGEESYSFVNKNKYINKLEGWKGLVDEEFKSLDKIIGAMENERQTRLSKLHRVVGSAPEKTQEILVHTSTGYYRFEGISKTFTRKLYEWEKSQGITPELSTFRLLDPLRYGISSDPRKPSANFTSKQITRSTPIRSKSVGCLLRESWRTRTEKPPNYSGRRPWSLSLNDLYRLEMRNCVGSEPAFLNEEDTLDDAGLEDLELEPEAMIVDIEDVIEETASPLTKLQPHQTPVYSVAGSETTSIAIPLGTVTSVHEPSAGILIEPGEIRSIAVNHDNDDDSTEDSLRFAVAQPCPTLYSDESFNEDHHNFERLKSLENTRPIDDYPSTPDSEKYGTIMFDNLREEPQKTGVENTRTEVEKNYTSTRESNNFVTEEEDMAEAVITVGGRQHSRSKHHLKTRRLTDTQVGYEWYQNSLFTSKQNDGKSHEEEEEEIGKYIQVPNYERIIINKDTLNKIVVPTSSGTLDTSTINSPPTTSKSKNSNNEIASSGKKLTKEPKSVFVKTKRIVFSPFKRDSKLKNNSQELKVVDNNNDNVPVTTSDKQEFQNCLQRSKRMTMDIPKSPILSRKEYNKNIPSYLPKETSPSIRMMIKKYNEKIEGSNNGLPGSGTSSGSASPIWRSPVTQRRIATRMEKYQEEVRKAIAGPSYHFGMQKNYERQQQQPGEISKSATIDFTRDSKKKSDLDCEESAHCVLRSETMPEIGGNNLSIKSDYDNKSNFIPSITSSSTLPSPRTLKIQKAKEDFFQKEQNKFRANYRDDGNDEDIKNLSRADLIKSASVGMINIESDAFERLQLSPAVSTSSNRGSDSLPRSSEQLEQQQNLDKSGKESRFHQLTSKFKKARLKKSRVKESASMSTVSMLCRQSLLVDIASEGSKSCPTTPSPSNSEHYEYSRNTN